MAETRVELNTGFASGPAGLSKVSKIALATSTPEALANDTGILKRKVLEPDEFPRVSLEDAFPKLDEYPNRGNKPMSDGSSLTK